MAFHLHLIGAPPGYVPAAAAQLRHDAGSSMPIPQLALRWELEIDGRLQARWTRV